MSYSPVRVLDTYVVMFPISMFFWSSCDHGSAEKVRKMPVFEGSTKWSL